MNKSDRKMKIFKIVLFINVFCKIGEMIMIRI